MDKFVIKRRKVDDEKGMQQVQEKALETQPCTSASVGGNSSAGQDELLYLGKDYPLGYDFFRIRCKRAFMKNREENDPEKIKKMLQHGEYVVKELETLYMLKKYRTLKRRYYNETPAATESPESESKS